MQSAAGNNPIADAFPSSESISEVRTDGAMNAAEFSQPGEVTVTTKAGTNAIHGSAFWYYQTAGFDAIPYTYPVTTSKPKLVANTFAAASAGRHTTLYDGHNRTFIFGAYEGWRHPASTTYQYIVPSTLMKQGNFAKYNVMNPGQAVWPDQRADRPLHRGQLRHAAAGGQRLGAEVIVFFIPTPTSATPPAIPTTELPITRSIRIRAEPRMSSTSVAIILRHDGEVPAVGPVHLEELPD